MRSRRARLLVVGFSIIAIAFTGWFAWSVQQQERILAAEHRDVIARLEAMSAKVDDMGAAQRVYNTASDELDGRWLAHVGNLVQEFKDEAGVLSPRLTSHAASDTLRNLVEASSALLGVDDRAHSSLRQRRQQAAADLIAEGQDILDAMLVELRNLRFAEASAREAAHATLMGNMWLAGGAAALLWLGGLFLLLQVPASATPMATVSAAPPSEERSLPAPSIPDPSPMPLPVAGPSTRVQDLATVCGVLSRVSTPSEFEGALAHLAQVLRARGIVVWLQTGERLSVAASQGYDVDTIANVGSISRGDQHATAAAWRTGILQTVRGGDGANSAVAVPIVDSTGCFGVLSAELESGHESNGDLQSAAEILAAQLGTLLWNRDRQAGALDADPLPQTLEASGM